MKVPMVVRLVQDEREEGRNSPDAKMITRYACCAAQKAAETFTIRDWEIMV
jgi:hypothetical protein